MIRRLFKKNRDQPDEAECEESTTKEKPKHCKEHFTEAVEDFRGSVDNLNKLAVGGDISIGPGLKVNRK